MNEKQMEMLRNKKFHNWKASAKGRGLSEEEMLEVAKDKADQWKYNYDKLKKD